MGPNERMIDLTLEQSFPASDPPGWTRGVDGPGSQGTQPKGGTMAEAHLYLTRSDYQRLNDVLRGTLLERREDLGDLTRLQDEIKRATIVEPAEIPHDVITMNSRVRLRDLDSGEQMEVSLVYPSASDPAAKKISILAPIGTAILGYRKGDTVEWPVPAGTRRLRIEEVLYQPEASGDFSL